MQKIIIPVLTIFLLIPALASGDVYDLRTSSEQVVGSVTASSIVYSNGTGTATFVFGGSGDWQIDRMNFWVVMAGGLNQIDLTKRGDPSTKGIYCQSEDYRPLTSEATWETALSGFAYGGDLAMTAQVYLVNTSTHKRVTAWPYSATSGGTFTSGNSTYIIYHVPSITPLACCLSDGSCQDVLIEYCEETLGGTGQFNKTCATAICPIP